MTAPGVPAGDRNHAPIRSLRRRATVGPVASVLRARLSSWWRTRPTGRRVPVRDRSLAVVAARDRDKAVWAAACPGGRPAARGASARAPGAAAVRLPGSAPPTPNDPRCAGRGDLGPGRHATKRGGAGPRAVATAARGSAGHGGGARPHRPLAAGTGLDRRRS